MIGGQERRALSKVDPNGLDTLNYGFSHAEELTWREKGIHRSIEDVEEGLILE